MNQDLAEGAGGCPILSHNPYPVSLPLETGLCIKTPHNFHVLPELAPDCSSSFIHSFIQQSSTDRCTGAALGFTDPGGQPGPACHSLGLNAPLSPSQASSSSGQGAPCLCTLFLAHLSHPATHSSDVTSSVTLDIVMYNKKHIWSSSHSWYRAPKTLGIFQVIE